MILDESHWDEGGDGPAFPGGLHYADDKINAFLRGDAWLKSHAAAYTAGLRALALEATHDPDLKALTRECAEYLVEAQGPKGTWTYRVRLLKDSRFVESLSPQRALKVT